MSDLLIEDVNKSFDGKRVLEAINLTVRAGELMVVLGPSGCGKSTLLRLISGLEAVDSGKIILDGRNITGLDPRKRKTAMVFQNYALYPHMTVFDNIAFPLKIARQSKELIRKLVQDTARLLELEDFLDRLPAQLSGGQRQRVALGRGLIRKPSIFLLDEPLSNLDAGLRIKMRQEIVALQKRLKITMIYVTHDQTEALTMADTIAILKEGRICQSGSPVEIYNNPVDKFVASFIGAPMVNLIDEKIKNGRGTVLPLDFGLDIPDGDYILGIRPENININSDSLFVGEICAAEYIGATINLRIRYGGIEVAASIIENLDLIKGQTADRLIGRKVNFSINPSKILLFDPLSGLRISIFEKEV